MIFHDSTMGSTTGIEQEQKNRLKLLISSGSL